jgi:ABC-type lipoprotein export system ATPase subunit
MMEKQATAATNCLLNIQKMGKQLGGSILFSGLDLQLKGAETLAITGESGAGKSTLLHIIATLESPDSGEVLIDGINPYALKERQRSLLRCQKIGLVFQAFYLLPHLSAKQNIALPWLLSGLDPNTDRIETLLKRTGMAHRADAKPGQLSGGEQQRVAIARALALNPPLILADEPTGNLDAKHAAGILDLLLEETSLNGQALVMVTHSGKAAQRMQRTLRLESGRLTPQT